MDNNPKPDPLVTSAGVSKMLNSISWYYKRTNVLDIPESLLQKLPLTLTEICKRYTN